MRIKRRFAEVAARDSCARWNLGAASHHLKAPRIDLPPAVREACLRLKGDWRASLRRDPVLGQAGTSVVDHPSDPNLRAKVTLHLPHGDPLGRPSFLVEFVSSRNPKTVSRTSQRALLASLTPRERELIRWICEGRSNQEIAGLTARAVGTVKNALHRLF